MHNEHHVWLEGGPLGGLRLTLLLCHLTFSHVSWKRKGEERGSAFNQSSPGGVSNLLAEKEEEEAGHTQQAQMYSMFEWTPLGAFYEKYKCETIYSLMNSF